MFLESMTNEDLTRIFKNEKDFLVKNLLRFAQDIKKASKTRRPFPLYFYRYCKSPTKNEYLLLGATSDGKDFMHQVLASMTSLSGKKLFSTIDTEEGQTKDRFTAHFINRYAERHLKKNVATELALAMFFHRNVGPVLIYSKETKPGQLDTVFAINDGVSLAKTNLETGVAIYNTFISDDLLGTPQRIAKQKMLEVIPDEHYESIDIYQNVKAGELYKEAQSIYESFFNDDATDYLVMKKQNDEDELKLNFKLKTSEEKLNKNNYQEKEVIPQEVYISVNEHMAYHGTMSNSSGYRPTGIGTLRMRENCKYTGELKNGLPHGKGTMTTPDSTYTGMFKDGKVYGLGVMKTNFGTIEGFFNDGDINGQGKYVSKDGAIYEGEFKNGEMHGRGQFKFIDGSSYDGIFKNGHFVRGKITNPDGTFVIGRLNKHGNLEGTCKKSTPNGEIRYVKYKDGEIILVGGIAEE